MEIKTIEHLLELVSFCKDNEGVLELTYYFLIEKGIETELRELRELISKHKDDSLNLFLEIQHVTKDGLYLTCCLNAGRDIVSIEESFGVKEGTLWS